MRANYLHLHATVEAVLAAGIPGDLAEFGVWHGTTFLPLAEQARRHGRCIHAVDSFAGMAQPTAQDAGKYPKGSLNVGGSTTFRMLTKPYGATVQVHEGWVPEILDTMDAARFCFVHLDLDHFQPTLKSLRWLWPRLSPGAIVACHDWNNNPNGLAAGAIDIFMNEQGITLHAETLDTGHAFLRKAAA